MAVKLESILSKVNVSICAHRREMRVGKHLVRILGDPQYVGWRINKDRDSFILFPCESKDKLSFKVPDGLHGKGGRQFRITSKSFITEIFEKNDLDFQKNYMIPGTFVPEKNMVVFNVADAYEHMATTEEE